MTRAVSNTSPLRYLVAADRVDILGSIFSEVLVPQGVAEELADFSAPSKVRDWFALPPVWLSIRTVLSPASPELIAVLDRGEHEAIQLMTERDTDVLIMDQRKGRAIAKSRGLPVTGVLGILGFAYQRAIIDDPIAVIEEIRQHGFYVADGLISKFNALLATRYSR